MLTPTAYVKDVSTGPDACDDSILDLIVVVSRVQQLSFQK